MSDKEYKKIIEQYSDTWTTLSKHDRQEDGRQVDDFALFVKEIKSKILSHQYDALKAVNRELISLYWEIGKSIVAKQEAFGWGKSVVKTLSEELQSEFVGIKGFSVQNLWNMRQFYLQYREDEKLQPLVREISWTKNVVVFQKCKDALEREFYIRMTIKYGWTKAVLIHQIEGKTYESFLLNQNNFDKSLEKKYKNQAKLALKDEYNFDFLELGRKYSERELEIGLINKIREFLFQMGGDFSFIGNQYRLEVDGEEYFIDLLLYHRRLKALVVVELKIGKFKSEYAGKMNFYLSVINDTLKLPDENPSIGIIICKEKSRTTVEYALKESNQPIGVATYRLTNNLPKDYENLLPTPEEIIQRFEEFYEGEI